MIFFLSVGTFSQYESFLKKLVKYRKFHLGRARLFLFNHHYLIIFINSISKFNNFIIQYWFFVRIFFFFCHCKIFINFIFPFFGAVFDFEANCFDMLENLSNTLLLSRFQSLVLINNCIIVWLWLSWQLIFLDFHSFYLEF